MNSLIIIWKRITSTVCLLEALYSHNKNLRQIICQKSKKTYEASFNTAKVKKQKADRII